MFVLFRLCCLQMGNSSDNRNHTLIEIMRRGSEVREYKVSRAQTIKPDKLSA